MLACIPGGAYLLAMSDNWYYVYIHKTLPLHRVKRRPAVASQNCNPASGCALLGQQGRQARVERGQSSLLMNCEPEQVAVGDLLVAEQARTKRSQRFGNPDVCCPKAMRRMLQASSQHFQCVSGRNGAPRKCWVRNNTSKPRLSHSASRPTVPRILREPTLRPPVLLVRRPKQGNQHVYVQQKATAHRSSASSRFTCSDVTASPSSERSKTTNPFTTRVLGGALRPRRTNSESARPMASDRFSA